MEYKLASTNGTARRRPARRRLASLAGLAAVLAVLTATVGAAGATGAASTTSGSKPAVESPAAAKAVTPAATPLAFTAVDTITHTLRGNFIPASGPVWEDFSSPAIGDITGDSSPEIVMGTIDGYVYAFRSTDYSELWRTDLGDTAIEATPVIARLPRSSTPDVIIGTMDGRIVVLAGPTGKVLMTLHEGPPLYCPTSVDCRPHGFFATPVVADIDGDGEPEIVAASWDHTLYAWKANGTLIFRKFLYDSIWSSPAVGDIDGDGKPEIVVGSDIYAGNPLGVPAGGLVWAFKLIDGTWQTYPGYPVSMPGQTTWSSPALGDINGDGKTDIVVGTGNNFPSTAATQRVYAFTAETRQELPGWPVSTTGQVSNGPALGDIDNDGKLEVAFGSEGARTYVRDGDGADRWTACAMRGGVCSGNGGSHGGVTLADIDNDGVEEVLSAQDRDLIAFDGKTGAVKARIGFGDNHTIAPSGSPTVADIGGTGLVAIQAVEKVTSSGPPTAGDQLKLYLFSTGQPLCRADWPTFKRTLSRTSSVLRGSAPWYPFTCGRNFVLQQYADILGRAPDAGGVWYWTDQMINDGLSGAAVIDDMLGSSEFQRDDSPIVRLYLGIYGQPPSSTTTFRSQVTAYKGGETLAQIADSIVTDPTIAGLSDSQFVTDTYQNLLGRAPTSSEQQAGVTALQSESRGTWLVGLSQSTSAVTNLQNQVIVTLIYLGMLDRVPDLAGFQYWVGQIQSEGAISVITGFQHSSEYVSRVT